MKKTLFTTFSILFYSIIFSQTQMVQNGNFAIPCCTGISWTSTPDFYYNTSYTNWHSNPGYAYMSTSSGNSGNNLDGVLFQTISNMPSNVSAGLFSFWYSITTSETTTTIEYDYVDAYLTIDGSNNFLGRISNLDNTAGNYSFYSYSLNNGQISNINNGSNFVLKFIGHTDGGSPSTFRIDDVSLIVNTSSVNSFDLTTSNGVVTPSTVNAGGYVDLDCDQDYSGNCCSGSNLSPNPEVGYYFSTNITLEIGTDIFIGSQPSTIGDSDPSDPESFNNYQIPSNTPSGTYYILYVADYNNQHTESNESNNVSYASVVVNGSNPCIGVTISQQPSDQSVTVGNTTTFSVTANGTTPITYQWKKNGVNISGATISSYTTPTLSLTDNGTIYSCQISNCNGTITSSDALLTVTSGCTNVSITQHPQNVTKNVGQSATFSITASGTSLITYQWQKNGSNIAGANSASYTTPTLSLSDNGNTYRCRVTNCSGSGTELSNNATLTVNNSTQTPTVQLNSPNGGEIYTVGDATTITATISGSFNGVLLYYSYDGGSTWDYITGMSTTNSNFSFQWLSIPNTPSDECKVKIEVLYSGGTVEDNSNAFFEIVPLPGGQEFDLNQNISHLFWPFPNSSYHQNKNNPIRDGWKNLTECCFPFHQDYGHLRHVGNQYFSEDWNRTNGDCNFDFLSPLSGTVIYVRSGNTALCVCPNNQLPCEDANIVVVRSNQYPDFAFAIVHLNSINVILNQNINVGDKLGEIGSTGQSTSSHAHCTLYKNINVMVQECDWDGQHYLSRSGVAWIEDVGLIPSIGIQTATNISARFIFDATYDPGTGGVIEPSITTNGYLNCNSNSVDLTAPIATSYFWNTGETTQTITVTEAGQYSVQLYDINNNPTDVVSVIVSSPDDTPVEIETYPTSLCTGSDLILYTNKFNAVSGDGEVTTSGSFSWSNGSTDYKAIITQPGTYWVEYTDGLACNTSSDTIVINEFPSPSQPTIQVNENQLASNSISGGSYLWYLNGDSISGAINQFYTALEEGYYTVEVTNQYGCKSTSEPVFISSEMVGVNEIDENIGFNIYPNPAKNVLFINNIYNQEIVEFNIYNSIGKLMLHYIPEKNQKSYELDVSQINSSICFVEIKSDNQINTFKIIISK